MQFRSVAALSVAFSLGALACTADDAATSGGQDAAGGSGGAGGAADAKPTVFASFVAEEGAGVAPAMLRMVNDTDSQILSLTLPTGDAFTFYLIEPTVSSDYALISSADMFEDAILSLHTLDTCVRRPFSEMNGPMSLEPGRAYSIHVSVIDGFVADIVEEAPPEPFVGLRAIIDDPATSPQVGKVSTLYVSGSALGELAFEDIYDELPAPYVSLEGAELVIDELRFTDREGIERSAQGPLSLEGSFGYTVYLTEQPVDGAALQIELE